MHQLPLPFSVDFDLLAAILLLQSSPQRLPRDDLRVGDRFAHHGSIPFDVTIRTRDPTGSITDSFGKHGQIEALGFQSGGASRDLPEGLVHEVLKDEFVSPRGYEAIMNGKDAQTQFDAIKENPLCHPGIDELAPDALAGCDLVPEQRMCLIECPYQPLAAQQLRGQLSFPDAAVDAADRLCPGGAVDDDVERSLDVPTKMPAI